MLPARAVKVNMPACQPDALKANPPARQPETWDGRWAGNKNMVLSRRHFEKYGKPPLENKPKKAYNFDKENKKLSGAEEHMAKEKIPGMSKHGKKRPSKGIVGDMGGEVHNMLEKFRGDVQKTLLAKRKRVQMYTKTSFKASSEKFEQAWKTQQDQWHKLNSEYSQQFMDMLKTWDSDTQKYEKEEEALMGFIHQLQKNIQQYTDGQNQRFKRVQHLHDHFIKGLENIEKDTEALFVYTQNELRKEMAMLQKKLMMETQQQEVANVRKSLQSMLF